MGPARAPLWLRSKARGRSGLGGGRQPGGPALPWPRGPQATASAPPSPVTAPEVPGCGLHVAAEGQGLCEVSTEPTPHSKQLPRVGPGSLLPPGCGRVTRPAGPSGGFPAGRGRHRPSVDSSQRRKPAGVLGARPGSALPSPEPAVSAAPGEDPAAPGRSGTLGEGSSPTQATPTPVPSQSSCCPGKVAPQNPGLWTLRRPV